MAGEGFGAREYEYLALPLGGRSVPMAAFAPDGTVAVVRLGKRADQERATLHVGFDPRSGELNPPMVRGSKITRVQFPFGSSVPACVVGDDPRGSDIRWGDISVRLAGEIFHWQTADGYRHIAAFVPHQGLQVVTFDRNEPLRVDEGTIGDVWGACLSKGVLYYLCADRDGTDVQFRLWRWGTKEAVSVAYQHIGLDTVGEGCESLRYLVYRHSIEGPGVYYIHPASGRRVCDERRDIHIEKESGGLFYVWRSNRDVQHVVDLDTGFEYCYPWRGDDYQTRHFFAIDGHLMAIQRKAGHEEYSTDVDTVSSTNPSDNRHTNFVSTGVARQFGHGVAMESADLRSFGWRRPGKATELRPLYAPLDRLTRVGKTLRSYAVRDGVLYFACYDLPGLS